LVEAWAPSDFGGLGFSCRCFCGRLRDVCGLTSGDDSARPALVGRPLLLIAAIRFGVAVASTLLAPIGYTSDELYYLACADHLAWGYVDHPPLSIAVLAAVRLLLGDSLLALRVVPALFESLAVLVTALLARELGGGRYAQVTAALAMAAMPMALAIGLPFSMNPIEHLLWPLAALTLARLQNGADAKWWLVLGLLFAIALENKLSTLWLGVGLAAGLAVSPARTWLRTRWPWLAGGLAVAGLAPYIAWQVANEWPTLEFIRNNATAREGIDDAVVMRSAWAFALSQLVVIGPLAAPLWLLGLAHLLRAPALRDHRMLGWAFAVVFALASVDTSKPAIRRRLKTGHRAPGRLLLTA
jgi:4-amino-4-deoxy-L-arabinose transferase-like glycosyltransferase